MNQVRVHGDPFGETTASVLLRSFLRLALGNGMRCALSLTSVRPRPVRPGEREVPLTDGVRNLTVPTRLPATEVEFLLRCADLAVAATAPVVVFAEPAHRAGITRLASLEWPLAATVLAVRDGSQPADLLERLRAELRWAGIENPPHALTERELQPWLSLPPLDPAGPLLHVGSGAFADGTDLVVTAWLTHCAASGRRLRLVGPALDEPAEAALRERLAAAPPGSFELVRGVFEPAHARDAAMIVLPWRRLGEPRALVQALASGRPVACSLAAGIPALLGEPLAALPIGGRFVAAEAGEPEHFAPHPRALAAALRQTLGEPSHAVATGRRARRHVVEHLTGERPAAPPRPIRPALRRSRPSIVLEAPFFENSSSAELSIQTARALLRRGDVDVFCVPVRPFRSDLATLRARAPEVEAVVGAPPSDADLWLSSGWPVRATRPTCRLHALRVDWEYGALPLELSPHVTQTADAVVVHSEHVFRALLAAGRPMTGVHLVPHGVDEAMHERVPPDPAIVAWKGDRPAVLFCGGLIWRKGFDVFLRAVLAAKASGLDFGVVVKAVGHDQHYGRFHLGELAARFRATPGTPPLLLVEQDLSRAQMAALYTACDVLVHPYRGEGFGLPVLEARACGLPVIATAGGATEHLMAGPGASKIPSARRELDLPGAHVSQPWILEPSPEATGDLLAAVLRDRANARAAAVAFAPGVQTAFPWAAAAESLVQLATTGMTRRRVAVAAQFADEPLVTLPSAPQKPAGEPVAARR